MEIEYKRTAEGSYMFIEGRCIEPGYEEKMLKNNEVGKLLSFQTMQMNGQLQFWYDISGMRSFRDIVTIEGITTENLYALFSAIRDAYKDISKYLISEEKIVIHPDTVFFVCKNKTYTSRLCYCPVIEVDVREQLLELMRFIIENVDHGKMDIMTLCYELYAISEQNDFSFYDIMERLEEEKDKYEKEDMGAEVPFITDEKIERIMVDAGIAEAEPESVEKEEFFERIKKALITRIKDILPGFLTQREKLLPERKKWNDIEFDNVPRQEGSTVMLLENDIRCSGRLIYESGGYGGEDIDITRSPFSIGSKPDGNDAVINSPAVSRYHAQITKIGTSYFVEDLNSTNSTRVNGDILPYHEPRKLASMDLISFADVVYRVV